MRSEHETFVLELRASVRVRRGDLLGARADLVRALELDARRPPSRNTAALLGRLAAIEGPLLHDHVTAISRRRAVVDLHEELGTSELKHATARISLANALAEAGYLEQAELEMRLGLAELETTDASPTELAIGWQAAAVLAMDRGEVDRAEALVHRALSGPISGEISPATRAYLQLVRSDVAAERGDWSTAVEAAERAFELRDRHDRIPHRVAYAQGQIARARWERAIGDDRRRAIELAKQAMARLPEPVEGSAAGATHAEARSVHEDLAGWLAQR